MSQLPDQSTPQVIETPAIQGRIFLVGCPRSGTTILQSLLAANSHIASFPETHFYERLIRRRQLLSALGIPTRGARSHWNAVLAEIGHPDMQSFLPVNALFVQQFSRAFLQVLDTISLSQAKYVWLEKTPGHLRLVDHIEKLVENARFIHLIRNGADNIASLYEVGKKYPETWGRWYGTLDQCIQRWVIDIRISLNNCSKSMHSLIKYEDLIASPKPALGKMCHFIDVPYEDKMLTDYPNVAEQIILKAEKKWKGTVSGPIKYAARRKFNDYLNEEQRKYILTQIPDDLIEYVGQMGR